MSVSTEQFFLLVHFFARRMLADDLKLSSDDDDTQRVGGALHLCPQLLNSDHDKSKCLGLGSQIIPLLTPDECLCGFYLCKNR